MTYKYTNTVIQIHKYSITSRQIQHDTKWQKDRVFAMLLKRGWFKDINKNDLPLHPWCILCIQCIWYFQYIPNLYTLRNGHGVGRIYLILIYLCNWHTSPNSWLYIINIFQNVQCLRHQTNHTYPLIVNSYM